MIIGTGQRGFRGSQTQSWGSEWGFWVPGNRQTGQRHLHDLHKHLLHANMDTCGREGWGEVGGGASPVYVLGENCAFALIYLSVLPVEHYPDLQLTQRILPDIYSIPSDSTAVKLSTQVQGSVHKVDQVKLHHHEMPMHSFAS